MKFHAYIEDISYGDVLRNSICAHLRFFPCLPVQMKGGSHARLAVVARERAMEYRSPRQAKFPDLGKDLGPAVKTMLSGGHVDTGTVCRGMWRSKHKDVSCVDWDGSCGGMDCVL